MMMMMFIFKSFHLSTIGYNPRAVLRDRLSSRQSMLLKDDMQHTSSQQGLSNTRRPVRFVSVLDKVRQDKMLSSVVSAG